MPGIVAEILVALVAGAASGGVTVYVAREKLRTEYRAEAVLHRLLKHPTYDQRSVEEIKFRLLGFDDNELRKLLIRSGAVRLKDKESKEGQGEGKELWGLVKRNGKLIE